MPIFGRRRGGPGRQPNQNVKFKLDAQGERELERQLAKVFERAAKSAFQKLGIETGGTGTGVADSLAAKKNPTGEAKQVAEERKQKVSAYVTGGIAAGATAISSFFADRFSTTDEALARAGQSAAVAGARGLASFAVEKKTGSAAAGIAAGEAAGELLNVGFERAFASGREVLARARESSTSRLEELAAEGFNISDEEIQRLQRYDLRRERNREEFKLRAAKLFEESASQLGISTTNFRGSEKTNQLLQGVDQKLARMIDLMNRRGGTPFRQEG